jgi:hypothetical protein
VRALVLSLWVKQANPVKQVNPVKPQPAPRLRSPIKVTAKSENGDEEKAKDGKISAKERKKLVEVKEEVKREAAVEKEKEKARESEKGNEKARESEKGNEKGRESEKASRPIQVKQVSML